MRGSGQVQARQLWRAGKRFRLRAQIDSPIPERLLSWGLVVRAYLWLGVLEAEIAMAAFFFVLKLIGWRYGEVLPLADPGYLKATSACFAGIVIAQMVNVFLCRHPQQSALRFGLFSNPTLLAGLALELALLLLIVYTPWGNALFGTAPLAVEVWLLVLPLLLMMGLLEECRKALVRREQETNPTGVGSGSWRLGMTNEFNQFNQFNQFAKTTAC